MALKRFPYKDLHTLLQNNISEEVDEKTKELLKSLRVVRKRGFLTKRELVEVCKWKSPRAIWLIKSNSHGSIVRTTEKALNCKNEADKMALLIQLRGVSVPMASAILTLIHPQKYGVIDIRVWEIIFHLNLVSTNSRGTNFSISEWCELLNIFRRYSKFYKVSARDVERTIFGVHKMYQDGILYKKRQLSI